MGKPSAQYVAKMEDVLSVYERPYDAARPVGCVDEARKELRSTPRGSLPAEPGQDKRQDYEYAREGWANLFLAVEPLARKRHVQVTERRTSKDFAQFLKSLSDDLYPDAERIVLVLDNLNTHKPSCLYEAFAAEEAFGLMQRFEWHYTPEHGSWLNVAEIELSVLERQCLARRLNREQLEQEVPAWEACRNALQGKVRWQFTIADARVKLRRLYPTLQS
ncbi:MAG TPA: IS630 family transposase [Chloroflexota bacterium]|nr:IS630 family transposase [Chloroflexota bacterium]